MLKYGIVEKSESEQKEVKSFWVENLEKQEEKMINEKYKDIIQQAFQLQEQGKYAEANKIYQKLKFQDKDRKLHIALNQKITRNLAKLKEKLQGKQKDFLRAQTATLQSRRQRTLKDYDEPVRERDQRYIQNREQQYEKYTQDDFYSKKPQNQIFQHESGFQEMEFFQPQNQNQNKQENIEINASPQKQLKEYGNERNNYQNTANYINNQQQNYKNQ
ncbi:hypothetical protein PPERSA_09485 [Pseudocohnilembus persalinus]|uniref:Uncharacterized protein n=1 Tax=Pseudocohnilembus persalinus TaxID=266149 RepID=A0A0V0QRX6_PSEPJ|nr:hypothetical protein PPERSA_09485 [Pseudocohnilembus persalinus]|eukprot:KRX04693.1 hypothetical protein PPERSA_09485 [Pseudocohnilembus persalinus]